MLTGRCLADRLSCRKQLLERLRGFVQHMSAQVSYALVPPERIIRDCDDGAGRFFHCCIEQLDKDISAAGAWSYAAENCPEVRTLTREERRLICELGSRLGVYDAQLQLSVLNSFGCQLEESCRSVMSEYRERSRLYTACSVLCGALVSILII